MEDLFNVNFNANLKLFLRLFNCSSVGEKPLIIKMHGIPGERRKRGRPRKMWMEGARAAMKTRHLEADQWLTLRRLMSYIYGAPILDVSRSHTTMQHSR